MIVDDFKALLVRTGQATAEEVAALEWDAADALGLDDAAVSPEPWQSAPEQLTPADDTATQLEGTPMTPLNPKQYAEEVRALRSRVKGDIEDSPEYAQLQARMIGNGPSDSRATAMPKAEIRNGQPYIPGYWTPTGYRGAVTGERAREAAGLPVVEQSAA